MDTSSTGHGPSAGAFRYQSEITAMMYTFGEVRHALPETTQLVESLVREQLVQLLLQSASVARRRGQRCLSHDDIIFLIRHDRMKVARLTAYLSWRKVRKIANRAGTTNVAGSGATSAGTSGNAGLLGDVDEAQDLVEEGGGDGTNVGGSGGVNGGDARSKVKKVKIKFPWQLLDQFEDFGAADNDSESGDETDEDEREFYRDSRDRLRMADAATKNMSQEEYMDYAECRQASFTYKKQLRFRDWINIEHHIGMKPSSDMLDIVGFLAFEMVRTITEASLIVQREMNMRRNGGLNGAFSAHISTDAEPIVERVRAEALTKYRQFSLL